MVGVRGKDAELGGGPLRGGVGWCWGGVGEVIVLAQGWPHLVLVQSTQTPTHARTAPGAHVTTPSLGPFHALASGPWSSPSSARHHKRTRLRAARDRRPRTSRSVQVSEGADEVRSCSLTSNHHSRAGGGCVRTRTRAHARTRTPQPPSPQPPSPQRLSRPSRSRRPGQPQPPPQAPTLTHPTGE